MCDVVPRARHDADVLCGLRMHLCVVKHASALMCCEVHTHTHTHTHTLAHSCAMGHARSPMCDVVPRARHDADVLLGLRVYGCDVRHASAPVCYGA